MVADAAGDHFPPKFPVIFPEGCPRCNLIRAQSLARTATRIHILYRNFMHGSPLARHISALALNYKENLDVFGSIKERHGSHLRKGS